jgi:hypothetical protein
MPTNPRSYQDLVELIESWQTLRSHIASTWNNGASAASLREFVEVHNAHTRKVIAEIGKGDPDFWSAWSELGVNAGTLLTPGAKIFVNGQDRTQL